MGSTTFFSATELLSVLGKRKTAEKVTITLPSVEEQITD